MTPPLSPLLSAEEEEILWLHYRYRALPSTLCSAFLDQPKAAQKRIHAQLRTLGLIAEHSQAGLTYFALTPMARTALFHDRHVSAKVALSFPALYRAYAFALFCAYRGAERLTRHEIRAEFPWLPAGDYYLTLHAERSVLGLLEIESSPFQLPARMTGRVQAQLSGRLKRTGFRKLLRADRVEAAVLVSTLERKEAVTQALLLRALPIHPLVFVLPELSLLWQAKKGETSPWRASSPPA